MFYVGVQILWQARYFGHGGGLWRALTYFGHVWLVFRNRRKSRAKPAFWQLDVVCGSALAANRLGRAAHLTCARHSLTSSQSFQNEVEKNEHKIKKSLAI